MLAVFSCVVGWVAWALREDIRNQLMLRDAHVLKLVLQHRIEQAERELLLFDFENLNDEQLWEVVLDTATAEGVFAAQLFSGDGSLRETTSQALLLGQLPPAGVEAAGEDQAYADFQPAAALSSLMRLDYREDREVSVQNLFVPLRSEDGELLGTGRFIMDGSALAHEFSLLDQRLRRQAMAAIGSGGVLIVGLFWFAWRRLDSARRELSRQAKQLRRSNAELSMLVRTSAVGSVAAHLIHGLKNPLAGLSQVVGSQGAGGSRLEKEEWENAKEATLRMQSMVQEVLSLLQDSGRGESGYDLSLDELAGEIARRFERAAERSAVSFNTESFGEAALDGHRANIVLLIVSNLVQNALDATPAGGSVEVLFDGNPQRLRAVVSDTGPGITAAMREMLFAPVHSPKEGGAGIGLAISMQLSRHISADLKHVLRREGGARFELSVPVLAFDEDAAS